MPNILIVDDNETLREQLLWAVRGEHRIVDQAANAEKAIEMINDHEYDVVITDMEMPSAEDGLRVLQVAKDKNVDTQVIVVTAYGSLDTSAKAMRLGAFDYLERTATHTDHLEMVMAKVNMALEFRRLKRESQANAIQEGG